MQELYEMPSIRLHGAQDWQAANHLNYELTAIANAGVNFWPVPGAIILPALHIPGILPSQRRLAI